MLKLQDQQKEMGRYRAEGILVLQRTGIINQYLEFGVTLYSPVGLEKTNSNSKQGYKQNFPFY